MDWSATEAFAGIAVLFVAGALFFGNGWPRIVPFTLGPRYFPFPSFSSLLNLRWVLSFLGIASVSLALALVQDIFDSPWTRYFYLLAGVGLYCSICAIALARKSEADELVRAIRGAQELTEGKCFEADIKKFKEARGKSVLTTLDDFTKFSKHLNGPRGQVVIWIALSFLTVLPIYAYVYVDHNYPRLKRYAEAVHPKVTVDGSLELAAYLYISRGTTGCLDSSSPTINVTVSPAATGQPSQTVSSSSEGATTAISCSEANLYLQNVRNQTFVVALLFMYFSFLIYFPLRYVASLFEYRALLRWSSKQGLGLETDVVQKCGLAFSLFTTLIMSLVLVNVPFGQIGVFSGVAAAGLSIALRDTLGNLLAGALLIWDGTLKKGDVLTIPRSVSSDTGGTYGIVREMRMRYTIVEDRNTVRRLIPNSILVSGPIESWTHADQKVRLNIRIGVKYGTDLRDAKQIMESVCYDVPRILHDKAPQALVVNFGDSAIEFSLRFWLRDTSEGIRPVISEILIGLAERFKEAGIEMPFPQRDLHIRTVDGSILKGVLPGQTAAARPPIEVKEAAG